LHKGTHVLIDCRDVRREVCLDDRRMLETMARSAERAGATVISQVRYRFGSDSPPGFTAVVVLDESHCSVHTYADFGLMAIDIFTCGTTDPHAILEHIRADIDLGETEVREIRRFGLDEPPAGARLSSSGAQPVNVGS
jgi:S-adenosylmethionine decarboxylase